MTETRLQRAVRLCRELQALQPAKRPMTLASDYIAAVCALTDDEAKEFGRLTAVKAGAR